MNMKHILTLFALFTSDLFADGDVNPNCCFDDSSTLCKDKFFYVRLINPSTENILNPFECCGRDSCSGGSTSIEFETEGTLICRGNSVCRDARILLRHDATLHCYGGNDACAGFLQLHCEGSCNFICDGSNGDNVCGGSSLKTIRCADGLTCYNYCIGGNGVCNGISRRGTWIVRDYLPPPTSQPALPQPSKAPTMIPTINPTPTSSRFPTQKPSAAPSFNPTRAPTFSKTYAPTQSSIPASNPSANPSKEPSTVSPADPISDEESGHGIFLFIGIGIGAVLVFILLLRCCYWGQASVKGAIGKDKFQFHEANEIKVEMNSESASSQIQLIQYSKVILDGSGNLVSSQAAGHSEKTLYRTSQSIKEFYYQTWDVEEDDLYIRRKRKRAPSPSIKQAISENKKLHLKDGDVVIKGAVASGNFGHVFEASYRYSKCAVKTIDNDNLEAYIREGDLLFQASFHPNICRFYGLYHDKKADVMYLVMDFFPDGSIVDAMKIKKFTKEEKITMCHQLAIGAFHLKSEGIFHGDIGARNCLISLSSQTIGIAITDFGLSCNSTASRRVEKIAIRWASPEYIKSNRPSFESDCWAIGATFVEIINDCKIPYGDMETLDVIEHIIDGGYPMIDQSWEIASLLESIFVKRSGIEKIVSAFEEMHGEQEPIMSYGGDDIDKDLLMDDLN